MFMIPAIDLKDGRVVRLRQGRAADVSFYDVAPDRLARSYRGAGARELHVVDLDGAFSGRPQSGDVVAGLCREGLAVQVGGGLRDHASIEEVLGRGASRIVLGTRALTDPEFLLEVLERHRDRVIVGIDALDGEVRTEGWTRGEGRQVIDCARELAALGVKRVLYTSIGRDGMLSGPDVEGTRRIAAESGLEVIASGGVSSVADLVALARHRSEGVVGAVVGKALLEGRFTVAAALEALGEDGDR